MIAHPAFPAEPWSVRETALELDLLGQTESVFALANGHIGLRANLDEGAPFALPGTYLNSFYEQRPLPHAEPGYGYPESGQTIVNQRELDFRAGLLRRSVDWLSPAGTAIRVHSTRLVSFTQRSVAAILYQLEPCDRPVRVVVQSELVANEPGLPAEADPRAAAALETPLRSEGFSDRAARVLLIHSTKRSKLLMAAGMDHLVDAPDGTEISAGSEPDVGRVMVVAALRPGQRLRLVKFLAYGWSSLRSLPDLRDQVAAALAAARHSGWEGLRAEQRRYLDEFWASADVEIDGDIELQQALRFALFHTLQAGARAEQRAIGAKGLTGPGYDGHTFWDTKRCVLPLLTYTAPK